jgi:hypothetical protein
MFQSRVAQRTIIAIFFAVVAFFYVKSWLAPEFGLYHDDAVYLVTAKAIAAGHGYTIESLPQPIPQTKYPPLFPSVLALFVLISQKALWLKALPLACAAGWFWVTWKLLLKMGASREGALLLVGLTAASPFVIFLATNLMSETMFALLVAAALLFLLDDRPAAAGMMAGLATLTRTAGAPLIVACILTLVIRRRLRSAAIFTAVSALLVAPWLGWSLARAPHDGYYGQENYVALNILSSFAANEKVVIVTHNALFLLSSIPSLLTGFTSVYTTLGVLVVGGWCLFARRQLVPDLFLALYCAMLLCWAWPPQRFVVPVLPLILWLGWRVLSRIRMREALAACIIIVAGAETWAAAHPAPPADKWADMQTLFDYVKGHTSPDSVVMANLDPVIYLNTGRKAVRGFVSNGYGMRYAATPTGVTPDELSRSLIKSQVNYVVVSPDLIFAEAPSFHRSVEALEHGGVLEPVAVPGAAPGYRLLHVTQTPL